ncbi:CRISPR-associated protein, family [mine drainage metagenome]|uniref:CRISPR-associated protein, family n=1 Tax=mine drainage metagenome TaxID=410659 RepID=T1B8I6_9ZZZZ
MERKYTTLEGETRILMEIELEPVQGERFQSTGFPDLGAAVYERPDGKRMLLVETVQSVANRMESVCLERGGPRISEKLAGLSYILVNLSGENINTETSSLMEAHRINSPFIISDKIFAGKFKEMCGYSKGKPIDWKKVAQTLFYFDINSLLHGAFLANLEDGRIRVPRAISGFIEAENIREVSSGGVKNNPIDPTGKIRAEGFDKDVYSNVPFYRIEYTAEKIKAYFNLDLSLIDGYGLDPDAKDLLISLSFYKIALFLKTGLRLRTACDLKAKGNIVVKEPQGFQLPDDKEIYENLKNLIQSCTNKNLFANPAVTKLNTKVYEKKDKVEKEKKGDEKIKENNAEEAQNND